MWRGIMKTLLFLMLTLAPLKQNIEIIKDNLGNIYEVKSILKDANHDVYLIVSMNSTPVGFFTVGEVSVTLIESIIIYFVLKLGYKKSLLLSFLCNSVSVIFGLIFLR